MVTTSACRDSDQKECLSIPGEGVCTLDIDILAFRLYYTFNKISADTEITMTFLRDESLGGKSDPNQQTGAIRADPSTQNSFQRK